MSLVDVTVTVRRGGTYLTIPANAVDRYMAKGFDVVDDDGNVLKTTAPNDVNLLKKAYDEHVAKIAELEAKVKQLERELKDAKAVKKAAPVVEPEVVKPKISTPIATTTRRSSKK